MRSRLSISLALFIGVLGLGACTEGSAVALTDPEPGPATVTDVTVTPSRVTLVVGTNVRLSARVSTVDDRTPPAVAWRTSSPNIADVSDDGLVSSVAPGSSWVLAQAGTIVDSAEIVVVPPPPAPVASLTVIPAAVSAVVGANVQLAAVAKDAAGNTLTGRVVTWSTNAPAIATVNGSGLVAAVASGSASITATSEGKSGSSTVTITTIAAPVASVSVTPASASVQIGQTLQLTATPKDANGTALGGRVITWASSNPAAATVNGSGLVTGAGSGSATITATSEGQSGTSTITMTSPPAPVASVEVTPGSASIVNGQTVQLTATPKDASGAALSGRAMTWSSSNTNVATVSTSGLVTGRGVGSATITATSEGKSGTAAITATLVPVATVSVSPGSLSLDVGRTGQFTATARDASGNALSGRTTTWASSNTAVAAVNGSGVVVAIGAGTAQITATCEGKSAAATLTVTAVIVPPTGPCSQNWPAAVYTVMPLSTGQAFYVSPSGLDANPGTIDAPWKTLAKAFATLQPGQIAYLRAGTHGAKCSAVTFSRAGTASAPITVQGYPGERAVLNGQVRIDGSYFRLSRIVMEGPTCGNWGGSGQLGENMILMTPGKTHHVEVSHSEVFHGGWHAGISAGGDDIWVLNNYIHDNGNFNDGSQYNTSHGIYYHDGTRGVVANNILEHNFAKGLSARFSANHILVINNTVVGNGRSGMDIAENTNNWTFVNNIVMNNGNVNNGVGINTGGSSGDATNVLINNVFWNNGDDGTSHWDSNSTKINNLVANPLFVNPVNLPPGTGHLAYSNDYRLNSGSPAIGFASLTYALPTDLTGVCRLEDGRADAGAMERTP